MSSDTSSARTDASTFPGSGEIRLPGIVNAHSHAFQRALAGGAERGHPSGDTFWGWRKRMYAFLEQLNPDDVEAIAAQLYLELMQQGYTHVVEFHYLHHTPGGTPYDDPIELSRRIVRAAERAGIGLTLAPVLYTSGDFGGSPTSGGQMRFTTPVDRFVQMMEGCADLGVPLAVAPHSLRAVTPEQLDEVVRWWTGFRPGAPIHMHISEQVREVEASVAFSGQRPVEWLLEHQDVDARWNLVHATHLTTAEVTGLAESGATVILCPSTEGNLGDGVFRLPEYLAADGRIAIGSDSHVSRSPAEELRLMEYAQRLSSQTRNVVAGLQDASTARLLLDRLNATARTTSNSSLEGDAVVLDGDHPALVGRSGDEALDAWVFSGNETPVKRVEVGGVVRWDRDDPDAGAGAEARARITNDFRRTMRRLQGGLT